MENKNGTSSRKGCLWALNPARIEKMQEELHKWRRKDPITVRRSMARPGRSPEIALATTKECVEQLQYNFSQRPNLNIHTWFDVLRFYRMP